MLNPGNHRTFTLTEVVTFEVLDAIGDRIESLEQNLATADDLHTERDLAGFRESIARLRVARAIIEGEDVTEDPAPNTVEDHLVID